MYKLGPPQKHKTRLVIALAQSLLRYNQVL